MNNIKIYANNFVLTFSTRLIRSSMTRVYLGIIYGQSRQITSKYILAKLCWRFLTIFSTWTTRSLITDIPGDHFQGIATNCFNTQSNNRIEVFWQLYQPDWSGRRYIGYTWGSSSGTWENFSKPSLKSIKWKINQKIFFKTCFSSWSLLTNF